MPIPSPHLLIIMSDGMEVHIAGTFVIILCIKEGVNFYYF